MFAPGWAAGFAPQKIIRNRHAVLPQHPSHFTISILNSEKSRVIKKKTRYSTHPKIHKERGLPMLGWVLGLATGAGGRLLPALGGRLGACHGDPLIFSLGNGTP